MINVLICDDDERFLAVLKNSVSDILRSMGIPAAVYAYSRAEDITEANYQDCDIVFLDIDFRGETYSGMDIARTLRRHGSKAVIVFVTDYIQFAPEDYEVQAFRYILKDESTASLRRISTRSYSTSAQQERHCVFRQQRAALNLGQMIYILLRHKGISSPFMYVMIISANGFFSDLLP